MYSNWPCPGPRGLAAFCVCVPIACWTSRSVAADSAPHWPRVLISSPSTRHAVTGALNRAARRLTDPRCRSLLFDFVDGQRRTLAEKLDLLDLEPVQYLRLLTFRDAERGGLCAAGKTLAFTNPGSRLVLVCGRQFERLWRENPPLADGIIIHEMLHTLGLRENPPSSVEITRRVFERCMR